MGYLILSILAVCSIVTWTLCLAKWGVKKDPQAQPHSGTEAPPQQLQQSSQANRRLFWDSSQSYQNLLLVSLKAFFRPEFGANTTLTMRGLTLNV